MTRFWENHHRVEKPQAWCCQLVRQLAIDQWRRDRRMQTEEHLPASSSPVSEDPFEELARREEKPLKTKELPRQKIPQV